LGKLGTERTVPLDEPTLADFDAWMAQRGPQRALIHPRHGQPADFLFVEKGRRLSAFRLRHGLDQAIAVAGLTGRDGQPLRVTPHQLRHYVDGWVMWPAGVFAVVGVSRGSVPAT
jgi:integrase